MAERGEDPVVSVRDLRKSFGRDVVTEVLHGVDLSIASGELVALVGPSGSGKSTLLNLLGLLDVPTSGSVRVLGQETHAMTDSQRTALRGSVLGFVFQFHHLLPALSVWENVALPLAASSGAFRSEYRDRAVALLEDVGLADRKDAKPTELSGGQQQRVAIARALVMTPRCVLADEPTGNLDTKTAGHVFDVFRSAHVKNGPAVVIVTHDVALAERCDRVVSLIDGTIVSDRTIR